MAKDPLKVTMRPEVAAEVRAAIVAGVTEVFELDIKPEAVRNSPVRAPKGPKNPRGIPGGTNKRSIDVEITDTSRGPRALLFTQSGYGGYLELGTRYMAARPYLKPAFDKFVKEIPQRVREKIQALSRKTNGK